ncbi:uncharacterized protein B0T15DRAFT_484445 [Chaetomium strumarium]|uniref:Uncharacterized protein n=1 Tax=Chaetomium strumarium TaxID=1170767 RepID=A0AAJ0M374_9PEZI|nr:hypothetical protein B0T15DRAFT_484445 [Chaetomium strumarium]
MAPPAALLFLLGATVLAGRTSAKCNRPGCNTDACARAVRSTRQRSPAPPVLPTAAPSSPSPSLPPPRGCTSYPSSGNHARELRADHELCLGEGNRTVWVTATDATTVTETVVLEKKKRNNDDDDSDEYESPPLPTSSVVFPDDGIWAATYTFEEYALPTFTDAPDPSIVVNYPIPSTTCMLHATPTGDSFYLLAPSAGYMFKKASGLAPVDPPQDEAAAEALLANWNPATFEFRVAEGTSAGFFDLVLQDGSNPDLYVALDVATGDVSLVPSSIKGKLQDGKCTTVFGVSCKGSLVVEYGSTSYVWTAANSSTIAAPGIPPANMTSPLNTMVILPTRLQTPLDHQSASRRAKVRRALARRDHAQDGSAPRCPNFPYGSVTAVSNGHSPSPPNGCGPDGAWYTALIPNLDFGGCCNNHDTCYDRCSEWFGGCNGVFHSCMRDQCANKYNHWYNSWLRPGCYAAAGIYYFAVSGESAQQHFPDGSREDCACVCADPNKAMCATATTCQQVRGAGANDSNNCGGCGRSCGPKGMCRDGVCVCRPEPPTPNQCGTTCLSFLSHPRNCGRCGNVCASGYCYQGACFTPPAVPDRCYPVEAVQNGDFGAGTTAPWSVPPDSVAGDLSGTALGNLPSSQGGPPTALIITSNPFVGAGAGMAISQTVRLCPGVQYQLDFQLWSTLPLPVSISLGGRVVASDAQIQSSGVWLAQGPFDLPVLNEGDAGTAAGAKFFLETELVISLTGDFVIAGIPDLRSGAHPLVTCSLTLNRPRPQLGPSREGAAAPWTDLPR